MMGAAGQIVGEVGVAVSGDNGAECPSSGAHRQVCMSLMFGALPFVFLVTTFENPSHLVGALRR